jgi:hypothetical protein
MKIRYKAQKEEEEKYRKGTYTRKKQRLMFQNESITVVVRDCIP